MTELRTLKDIVKIGEEGYGDIPSELMERYASETELRQEAIKWIRFGFKQLSDLDDSKDRMGIRGGIEAFKHFFNITEEDLLIDDIEKTKCPKFKEDCKDIVEEDLK